MIPGSSTPTATPAPDPSHLAGATTVVPGTEPPATTTTTVRPGAAVVDLGELTEANPRVPGNPGRDVGLSVRLADGRYLWLFGDTLIAGQVLSNTAGIAAAGSAAIFDQVDANGRLTQFIPYTAEEEEYNRAHRQEGSRWVLWPSAAIAVDGGTRVLVFFARGRTSILPGGGSSMAATGSLTVGVAEWKLADATRGGPLQARRLNDATFLGSNLFAAYPDPSDRSIWLISCGDRNVCRAAKASVADVADGTKWSWWTGNGFASHWRSGMPLAFPDPESAFFGLEYPDGEPFNAAPFAGGNVVWHPARQMYVFGFTAWPGFSNVGFVRASRGPAGPWGPPVRFVLPGCEQGHCYALTVHPEIAAGNDTIGISYHRPPFNRVATVDISHLTPG